MFGPIIRQRREELGLSQAALARLAGTRQAYISEVETGRRVSLPTSLLTRIVTPLRLTVVLRPMDESPTDSN